MNIQEFRETMAQLPEPPSDAAPPYWDHWRHDLWWRAQHDPRPMWDWPCLRHTMLVEHFPMGEQLAYLWRDQARWGPVLDDANPIHQKNLINQAYHLRLWEQTTGRRVEDLDSIYEFGGGYGALAELSYRLGFAGEYHICDLPEFALLQRHYLAGRGLSVIHETEPVAADLFIALYSLSETDADLRERWMAHQRSRSYLLLYSGQWAEHDNRAWARGFMEFHGDLRWHETQFPGRPDYYAIGWTP